MYLLADVTQYRYYAISRKSRIRFNTTQSLLVIIKSSAYVFDQDIGSWDTSQVTSMYASDVQGSI